MLEVRFHDSMDDNLLKFAVIISKSNGKWIFCKHRERDTYEIPGGRREENETILETARRELQEETGAVNFEIKPICIYSVKGKTRVNENIDDETFGMLFFADITSFGVKRDNISYNISLPVRRAIFLQVLKNPYSAGFPAYFPFLSCRSKARIFAGTFQS